MKTEHTTTINFGNLKMEVTRHDWDCGDGCCSGSGWTAEIDGFHFGDSERDGYLDQDAFVEKAVDAYFEDRDYKVAYQARQSMSDLSKKINEESNQLFHSLGVLYCHLDNIVSNDVFAKTKRAQVLKEQTPKLMRGIFERSPHQILLASCRDYQSSIDQIVSEQEKLSN